MKHVSRFLVYALISLPFLGGCISQLPTPNVARSGDVVNIGLGGVKRNAGGQLLRPSDITVTITDSNSTVHTPQIIGVYRVFPDHTSEYAVDVQDRGDINFNELHPHDGAYWMAIRLTDATATPLPLATGGGSISVSATQLTQTSFVEDGNYGNFPITILAGQRDPSEYGSDNQFLAYQTEGYFSISPDVTPSVTVGGMQLELDYNDTLDKDDDFDLRVVPLNHDPNSSLIQSVTDNGDGTKTLMVFLTNPNGFVDIGSWQQGQSSLLDLNLAIVSQDGGIAAFPEAFFPVIFPNGVQGYYVDLNGDVIAGVVPVVSNEFE